MYVKNLKLRNFRNYADLDLKFARDFNIICGKNAQGKTNILESIYLCASGRSHRTSKDIELIKLNEDFYSVLLEIQKTNESSSIEIKYEKDEKKKIEINEIPVRKIGSLMGHLNAVIFSPEDLQIVKEGPSERRRFLDITISQLRPSYFYDLQQYARIINQRNNLLKEIQGKKSLRDTLEIWSYNLAKTGARIIKARNEFIEKLDYYAKRSHYKLTNGKENLHVKYSPSIRFENLSDLENIENCFIKNLEKIYEKEISKGTTLLGPQRDDYDLQLNGMSIKLYGSQGQQRTAVLALKMSEIDIMKEDSGEYPVLLLDDVMSELDKSRQQFLFENLGEIQTFITCTERDFFNGRVIGDAAFILVEKGEIISRQ